MLISDECNILNEYTTPLQGTAHNRNEGIIKAVDFIDGSKYSVGEILSGVGLDYYDRLEWLIRTDMRAGNDNLIVERKQSSTNGMLNRLTEYAEKCNQIMISSKSELGKSPREFNTNLLDVLASGKTLATVDNSFSVQPKEVPGMLKLLLAQKEMSQSYRKEKQRNGIEAAKNQCKYTGRKRIEVDAFILQDTMKRFEKGEMDLESAMEITGITSKSTFYRRRKEVLGDIV